MRKLGIDVSTCDKNKLITRLARLKAVESAEDGGEYHEDRSYSQVHVVTAMSEVELSDWLYHNTALDYVGVFEMENAA